jgi:hypothetical protein
MANFKDRYRNEGVDDSASPRCSISVRPDVVHIGHLNHLSTSLVARAAREIPIVFTLHDYWLMCPRGQFMQMFPEDPTNLWAACDGQEDRKCAERCYARYFSGAPEEHERDIGYWSELGRASHGARARDGRARGRVHRSGPLPARPVHPTTSVCLSVKVVYLDYGFDRSRFVGPRFGSRRAVHVRVHRHAHPSEGRSTT